MIPSNSQEENLSIKDTGALGVFANYINSSDNIPTINTITSSTSTRGVRNRTTSNNMHLRGSPVLVSRPTTPKNLDASAFTKKVPEPVTTKEISNFDIGLKIISDLTGKDKVAKIALYSLRIILVFAEKFSQFYPKKFNNSEKYNLILQIFKSPKLLLGLLSKIYIKKTFGLINGLSLYRQLLRFGKTPFRVRNLLLPLVSDLKFVHKRGISLALLQLYENWFNESRLGELINLYYGITDETLTLYKMGVLSNPSLRKWAGVHECYAWYLDILLGLKQNYCKLQKLQERESSIKLNQQVRIKARQVIKNLKLDNSSSPIRNTLTTDQLDVELIAIAKEKQIVIISLLGLLCDFCFDTVDVFNLKIDRRLYLSFGLVSAFCGLSKLYIKFRDELLSE